MFDILFGWRKASKCKKLVKMVQCRLKLLKNKRNCIVKQCREDVAELLKHGHDQSAFERVEQIIMDENIVQVYDLLYQFCEFIIINLSYIRKHRDCPNDINEAASTLIFSSARFGELPELISIRKLFGERYGERFLITALQLLPGNLVNHQIKENFYIKKVSDDEKYRMLAEIASSCFQQGPLYLEYKPQLQEDQQATKGSNQISYSEDQMHNDYKEPELQLYIGRETEGKILYVDLSSETRKISKEPFFGHRKENILQNAIQEPKPMKKPIDCIEMDKFRMDSSSETSAKLPDEMIYLDDIEEFVSKDGINHQDQRLFMFKSFGIDFEEQKMRKASKKRSRRRRSLSQENRIVSDIECATYYGEYETSLYNKRKSHRRREPENKTLVKESRKPYGAKSKDFIAKKCSLEDPCYFCSKDENEALESLCKRPEHDRAGERTQHRRLRAMTMPTERPKESLTDNNIFRTNSFPFGQPRSGNSSCRHIHPKLPDYDELAATFTTIKRTNLQNERQSSNLQI